MLGRGEEECQLHNFYTSPYQATLKAEYLFPLAFSAGAKVFYCKLAVDKREIMIREQAI